MEEEKNTNMYEDPKSNWGSHMEKPKNRGGIVGGIVLITLGVLFLLDEFTNISFGRLWPIILIVIGISILLTNFTLPKKQ